MGMMYDVTFMNAIVRPNKYAQLLGLGREEAEALTEEELAEKAAKAMLEEFCDDTDNNVPTFDENGINLHECGVYGYAPYEHRDYLNEILSACEVGAYYLWIDTEGCSGEQWRVYVAPDGDLVTVVPQLTWHEPDFIK